MTTPQKQEARRQVLAGLDHALTAARRYIERVDSYGAAALVGFLPDLESLRARFERATAIDAMPIAITVQGKPHDLPGTAPLYLPYARVVELAGYDPNRILSVTYRRGPLGKPEGILSKGESVEVVPGMVFNVADTSGA
jgi:multiubiquitin